MIEPCDETELDDTVAEARDDPGLEDPIEGLCDETELEDAIAELRDVNCDVVAGSKLTGFLGYVNEGVPCNDNEIRTVLEIMTVFDFGSVSEFADGSSVAKENGCSEVVKLPKQQSTGGNICPPAPAQHQLLPSSSHRLTSV